MQQMRKEQEKAEGRSRSMESVHRSRSPSPQQRKPQEKQALNFSNAGKSHFYGSNFCDYLW